MRHLLLIIFVVTSFAQSQINGVVRDFDSDLPIAYANIYLDDNRWVSANEDGLFSISANLGETATFSAVGYQSTKVTTSDLALVKLKPATYSLENVMVMSPKRTMEKTVGGYRKKQLDTYYTTGGTPEIMGRYFPADTALRDTPFFKTLVINTKSPIRNAKFNVHFYEANQDGTPGRDLAGQNIIGIARKGIHDTEIDLMPFGLKIPENGFFIAVEWLIIPQNRYDGNSYTNEKGIYQDRTQYAPFFGTVRTETNSSWGCRTGMKWKPFQKVSPERIQKYYDDFKKATGYDAPPFDDRHVEFAMKLTMTN